MTTRLSTLLLALFATLSLISCGDGDDDVTSQGFFIQNGQQGNPLAVAGTYRVEMEPLYSSCLNIQPVNSVELFHVKQNGADIEIKADQLATGFYLYKFIVSAPPLKGNINSDGSYFAESFGEYMDNYTTWTGEVEWYLTGSFSYGEIQGTSDTVLFDPHTGTSCLLSHELYGYRY